MRDMEIERETKDRALSNVRLSLGEVRRADNLSHALCLLFLGGHDKSCIKTNKTWPLASWDDVYDMKLY